MARHTRSPLSILTVCLLGATTAATQHVLLPFSKHHDTPKLSARASEQTSLKSAQYAYLVDVSVGTPAQKLSLQISTSTADTWVPDANTVACSPDWYYRESYYGSSSYDDLIPASECLWGSFNKSLSSTYLPANRRYDDFSNSYLDGTYVSGDNMTDKLVIGNLEFDDYPMGLATYAYRWLGVLGLGSNQSSYYSSSSGEYPTVLDRMVSGGKIASPAYSIWLDNAEGTSGGLLFGAVDRSRYTGDLVSLSAYSSYSYRYGFGTTVSSINGTSSSGASMPAIRSNDFPLDVTLGPGEVFSYLPESIADQIAEMAGATYNRTLQYYTVPCDAAKTNNTNFVFELGGSGGPKLDVETADLVLPTTVLSTGASSNPRLNATNLCLFGIQKYYSSSSSSSSSSYYSYYNLGSSLLRRSYLVFDLANREIAVAPVKFPSASETLTPNIAVFEAYGAAIPGASSFCTSSYCYSSNDDDDDGYDSGSGSGSGSGPGPGSGYGSGSRTSAAGLERWQQVAIGVGVSFGVLILLGAIAGIFVCIRLRRGEGVPKEADEESREGDAQPAEAAAAAQNGTRSSGVLAGALPVIQEKQEEVPEPNTQAPAQAPQLPALGTELARAITPPEPTASSNSNRASVAVSALSDDAQAPPQAQIQDPVPEAEEAPAPASPKGKGKEVDRSAAES
jgi:hypothetical protein